jgi:hypothetical protein
VRKRVRLALRRRHADQVVKQRRAHLVQPGERQLHLGLDPDGAHRPASLRPAVQVAKQGRLPDAGLAVHDEHLALP